MKVNPFIVYFFVAAGIAIAIFADYLHQSYVNGNLSYNWVNHSNLVIKKIERVSGSVAYMESGYRGYVITGSSSFKNSFSQAEKTIIQELDTLRYLTSDNIRQQKSINILSRLVHEKLLFGRRVIQMRDSSSNNTVFSIYPNRGVQLTDSIRQQINFMLQEENRLLELRTTAYKKSQRKSYRMELYGRICAFILLILFLLRMNKDIRRREEAESKAKINEEKYKRLIEDAHVVMFTSDINGSFTFISERVKSLTGYTKEELLGKAFATLVKADWIEKVRDHYRIQMKQEIPETSLEFPILTKGNEIKWVEQLGVIRYNQDKKLAGMQFIVKDITTQKLIQLDIEKSEVKRKEYQQRLQSILDNSTSLVYMKDRQGKYLFINKKFESVMQIRLESLRGKTDFELHDRESARRYSAVDEWVFINKKPKEFQEVIAQPDGNHHYLIVKFPLYNIDHEVESVCGIATDITTRVQYEGELIEARKIAEQAEKFQEQFLANMSHDIRTPLNGIVGMTNLLSGTNLSSEQEEFIQAIKQSSDTLMVLVNDILDLSKIKAGKLDIECISFNIRELIDRSVFTLKQKAKEKGLQFMTSVEQDIPDQLKGDPHRLSQILMNLIGNSIKFTDKGEINLSVKPDKNGSGKLWIYFSVKDTGMGISEDKLDKVFDSFTQSGSDISRRYGGTGLGLAIVKQLVLLQGGEIGVESQPGTGSNFHFILPYDIPDRGSSKPVEQKSKINQINDGKLSQYRLLVAEDDLVNRRVIEITLKRAGVRTDIVENGEELIKLLQSDGKYDLILSDIHMPEMDGYQAARYIRQVLKLDIPILAMTATVLKEEKNLCLEAGMNDYISKPFSIDELMEKISFYVKDKKHADYLKEKTSDKPRFDNLYNLTYLRELDEPGYVKEILTLFLNSTPETLREIKDDIRERNWKEVQTKAHKLKSPVGMLQINKFLEVVTMIDYNAKTGGQLETMPELIEKAIQLYSEVQPLLEQERDKIET